MAKTNDAEALQTIISILARLDRLGRDRILRAVMAYFEDGDGVSPAERRPTRESWFPLRDATDASSLQPREPAYSFEDAATLSPKDFLAAKKPSSDVERVTCLAFYLSHVVKQKHFKTIDISRLNTDAAQPKLSNAAQAIANAMRAGFVAGASKGQRQLTAAGERYVQELPDHQKAREAALAVLPRRRGGSSRAKKKTQ